MAAPPSATRAAALAACMSERYELRPIASDDAELLLRIYASTRAEELAPVPWNEAQKAAFLRQQFEAQHAHYQQHYAGASFDLVLVDGQPVGRLYVARWPREIRLVDVALLPAWRGRGLGSALLGDLIAESRRCGKPLTIHVEHQNPALRLYERLGFERREDRGVYLFLERPPEAPAERTPTT
jgi:ribosomal protein S18 acetylase RimI-like enzyme